MRDGHSKELCPTIRQSERALYRLKHKPYNKSIGGVAYHRSITEEKCLNIDALKLSLVAHDLRERKANVVSERYQGSLLPESLKLTFNKRR